MGWSGSFPQIRRYVKKVAQSKTTQTVVFEYFNKKEYALSNFVFQSFYNIFFNSCEGFLRADLTGHGCPSPFWKMLLLQADFSLKMTTLAILSENNCHFMNLLRLTQRLKSESIVPFNLIKKSDLRWTPISTSIFWVNSSTTKISFILKVEKI